MILYTFFILFFRTGAIHVPVRREQEMVLQKKSKKIVKSTLQTHFFVV